MSLLEDAAAAPATAKARYDEEMQVRLPAAMVLSRPDPTARPHTQVLRGETVALLEYEGIWAKVHVPGSGYDGFVKKEALSPIVSGTTHAVFAASTDIRPEPDFKTCPYENRMLGMNARVHVLARKGEFVSIGDDEWVFGRDLRLLSAFAHDWVAECEKLVGLPYGWGYRDGARRVDCSGVIGLGLASRGIIVPHHTTRMERAIDRPIGVTPDRPNLIRGDIVFFPRHVGVMVDPDRILHATKDWMRTVIEPLSDVLRRREKNGDGLVTSVHRL